MKYYCKNCGSEIICGEKIKHVKDTIFACCICLEGKLEPLPDYETPEQREKRTGEPYPDEGLVWSKADPEMSPWSYETWGESKYFAEDAPDQIVVVADPPVPPPDNWRPPE